MDAVGYALALKAAAQAALKRTLMGPSHAASSPAFVLLDADRAYAIGGHTASTTRVNSVRELNLTTNVVTTKANFGGGTFGGQVWNNVAVWDGKIYTFAGTIAGAQSDVVWMYDPGLNTWTSKGAIPGVSASYTQPMGAETIGDRIYYIAGTNNSINAPTKIYNPATNTYDADGAVIPVEMIRGTTAKLNGKLYCYTREAILYEYDPVLNTWTTKASNAAIGLPAGYSSADHPAAAGLESTDRIYVSGTDNGANEKFFAEWIAATNTWAALGDPPAIAEAERVGGADSDGEGAVWFGPGSDTSSHSNRYLYPWGYQAVVGKAEIDRLKAWLATTGD